MDLPRTLIEAIRYFSDPDNCHHYMVERRWPTGEITCPTCGGGHLRYDRKRRVYHCNAKHPRRQFSVKVGTIFEDSPLGLDKLLPCVWMVANMKNGVSSHEIGRSLGVTQKTAWFMLHRIRLAMKETYMPQFSGTVDADETYVGGKVKNMHAARRREMKARHWAGKVAVMGLLERHGRDGQSVVRAQVISGTKRRELFGIIKTDVALGSNVMTDALPSYASMNHLYVHQFVDHTEQYVNGNVHTNGIENFRSLLKRAIHGTYISVEPFHLERYLDEQMFRFNHRRGMGDRERFNLTMDGITARRLTYEQLTAEGRKTRN
jgi:hypothetical protein